MIPAPLPPVRHKILPISGLIALTPFSAMADAATPPSGQPLTLHERLVETDPWSGAVQLVIRLLAPMIAQDSLSDQEIRKDMDWACKFWGHPTTDHSDAQLDWVIVEMMAAPTSRGTITPDIQRFYETYRRDGDLCIWELF